MSKRLYLGKDRKIGGVCSGIAEYFDIDVTLIRIAYILLFFYWGLGILPYLLMWMIIPKNDNNEN